MTKKHSKNNYSDNAMKTIAYIMSTYVIGTHNLDIRDVLKSYIIARSNEEILELISGLDYIGNIPTVPDLGKPIEIQVSTTRQIPLEQNKEVQTKIKEIIYNNLYDTLIDELKGTISRFQAQYNIQEINPYLQDILQNPEDLVSLSQHHKR